MDNGKTIGMILFIGGIILLIGYGLYLGFDEIMESLNIITGLFLGITLVGLITLIISIILEQRHDTKQTMKKIKKEDLEP
jgi:uncharacterized membrane protein (DUF106 family)